MSLDRWTAVDRYIADTLVPPDPALDAALQASTDAGLPEIAVSPAQGRFLHVLARAMRVSRILELGTLGGYSAIWLARALSSGGRMVTIEADPKHADVARANFQRAGVGDRIDLRVGKGLDVLPQLVREQAGPFDLIFIDADKVTYPDYLEWSLKLSKPGTLILADNIVRDGEVANPTSEDAAVQAVRRFNAAVAANPRLAATVIQTVGVKGYDGFAAVLVTG